MCPGCSRAEAEVGAEAAVPGLSALTAVLTVLLDPRWVLPLVSGTLVPCIVEYLRLPLKQAPPCKGFILIYPGQNLINNLENLAIFDSLRAGFFIRFARKVCY